MYFAFTPVITMKPLGCLQLLKYPRAGGGGRTIGCKRLMAAPRMRTDLDVARWQPRAAASPALPADSNSLDVIRRQRGSSNALGSNVSCLWHELRRGDARGRLRVFLRVPRLPQTPQTNEGGLLRVLLIRNRKVPSGSSLGRLLWSRAQMTSKDNFERAVRRCGPRLWPAAFAFRSAYSVCHQPTHAND